MFRSHWSPYKKHPSQFPPTYIVIQFKPCIPDATVKWIIQKIYRSRKFGGGELFLRKQPGSSRENGVILHISASVGRLLEVAEDLDIRKKDKNGVLRHFSVSVLEEFVDSTENLDSFFTTAECQSIVRHELENIRALNTDKYIEGFSNIILYEGQSIIQACLHWEIISQMFPLHEPEVIKKLGDSWYKKFFTFQPYDEIHKYFGEAIALYFHFLGFYNCALLIPMLLGFYQMVCGAESLTFFCVFNVLWATGFMEVWRRKSAELAFKWGTITTNSLEGEPRLNFIGKIGVDKVTGRLQPQYPYWKTMLKMYVISFPIVLLCMVGAFFIMLFTFWVENVLKRVPGVPNAVVYIPSGIYCALIFIMNKYYRQLANCLTEWENHKTQTQFDRYRVTKLILFEFINNFMSLFYIAFYIQDMEMLRTQIMIMLIILQVVFNIKEAFIPFAVKYYNIQLGHLNVFNKTEKRKEKAPDKMEVVDDVRTGFNRDIQELDLDDERVEQVLKEVKLEKYDGTYDDYLELFVQFGYVLLFAAVYPMAAFWAFLNNFIEIRSDAFKLCLVCQRPMASRVKDIGAWQKAFEALCALSIVTNCALLYINPSLRGSLAKGMNSTEWLMMCVAFEHVLFLIRQVLSYVIPEKPRWVRMALAKADYQSKQMLKKQRLLKNRRKLTFLDDNGPEK